MVTPVVKRQAMAHLAQVFEVSQRRACQVIVAIERPCAIAACGLTMQSCALGCASLPLSGAGLAIGACNSCYTARARA